MVVSATPVAAPSKVPTTKLPSRPTTPLRPASRTSLRASRSSPSAGSDVSAPAAQHGGSSFEAPLATLEPAFAELADSMADLEANFMHLQILNESVARFNENFAAFLYGLNMTAFCVDFPEAPTLQSFNRHGSSTCQLEQSPYRRSTYNEQAEDHQHEATFLTTDASFVVNPPSNATDNSRVASGRTPGKAVRGTASSRARGRGRGSALVAGTDAMGRRTTKVPAGGGRGTSRGGRI